MHTQLEALEMELDDAQARLHRLVAESSESDWERRQADGRWSAADCIAHLNLTTEANLPRLDQALADARSLGGGAPRRFRRDPMGWMIWKSSAPNGRMKVSTKPAFLPAGDKRRDELARDFERLQAELVIRLRAADGLPIHRVRMTSAFDARVRYSLFSALSILAAHEHRHLGQAERAVAAARGMGDQSPETRSSAT